MTELEVVWTETAEVDLDNIASFIATDDITNAFAVAERIRGRCEKLARHPRRGRPVPELRGLDAPTHRELTEGPWRIVYRHDERYVFIVSVLDARRDLAGLLLERLVR